MGNLFKASEIVEVGIQIEKNGRDFYSTLVGQSKDQKAKDMFNYLASEEEKHIGAFQKILDSLDQNKQTDSYPGEYLEYMNSLADKHVFAQKDKGVELAKNTKDDKEAIDLGIGFEKDSITFYEGVKKVVLQSDHKAIDGLIVQEQSHLKQLTELKEKL